MNNKIDPAQAEKLFTDLFDFLENTNIGKTIALAAKGNKAALDVVNEVDSMRDIKDQLIKLRTAVLQAEKIQEQKAEYELPMGKYLCFIGEDADDVCDMNEFDKLREVIAYAVRSADSLHGIVNGAKDGQPKPVEITIGRTAHPIDVAFNNDKAMKELGLNIANQINYKCGKFVSGYRDALDFDEANQEALASVALSYAKQNMKLRRYSFSHEVVFRHHPSDSVEEQIANYEAEYLARQNGWRKDQGQIFKVIKDPDDPQKQHIERVDSWIEAMNIDKGCAVGAEDGVSPGLS